MTTTTCYLPPEATGCSPEEHLGDEAGACGYPASCAPPEELPAFVPIPLAPEPAPIVAEATELAATGGEVVALVALGVMLVLAGVVIRLERIRHDIKERDAKRRRKEQGR